MSLLHRGARGNAETAPGRERERGVDPHAVRGSAMPSGAAPAGGRWALAAWLAIIVAAPVAGAAPAPADSAAALRLTRADAAFALGTAGVVAIAAANDARWSAAATADGSDRARHVAEAARRLGDDRQVAAALLATDALARLAGRPGLGAAAERVAVSAAVAGAGTLALKLAVGRHRPDESPDRPWRFSPFSLHDSFPSGHATLAFALAGSVTAEAHSRGVPLVLVPAAALTAWSRVHDRRHWPSDVLAGAAVGGWLANRTDHWAQRRLPRGLWVLVWPRAGGTGAAAGVRF